MSTGVSRFLAIVSRIPKSYNASAIFTSIIEKLDQESAAHKNQFKKEKLVAFFPPTLGYHISKVFESIQRGESYPLGAVNLHMVQQALKDFQSALTKRGIELDTYDAVKDVYDILAFPMTELETYFQYIEKGEKPNINAKTAYIFAFFITKKIDELKDVAKEIDEEYAQ